MLPFFLITYKINDYVAQNVVFYLLFGSFLPNFDQYLAIYTFSASQ